MLNNNIIIKKKFQTVWLVHWASLVADELIVGNESNFPRYHPIHLYV